MSTAGDPLVVVCRDPRDHQRARVRLSALDAFGFDAFSDGDRSRFSRAMLVAFVAPADIVDGQLRRSGSHGTPPDRVKVAITRTQNQAVYPIIERMVAAARIAQLAPIPRRRVRLDAPAIPTRICAPVAPPSPASPAVPEVIDVAALRARTGLCSTAFAARIGVKPSTLFAWEIGRHAPRTASRERLFRIEQALHPGATRHSG